MTTGRSFVLGCAFVALGGCNRGGAAGGRSSGAGGEPASGDASSTGGAASGDAAAAPTVVDGSATVDGADSTVVLTVTSNDGTPLVGVSTLVVTVQQDGGERVVTFSHAAGTPIEAPAGVELSLGVTTPEAGSAIFSVEARTATACLVAKGLVTVSIASGATVHAAVALARLDDCSGADAGASDGGASDGGRLFPGCDPVTPDCPDGMLCQVACATHTAACVTAGDGFHGTACASDADCAPGTQCFDYAGAGCAVKICRHFCDTEANCPQPVSLAMPRNVCTAPVSCSDVASAYHTCSVSCDPTSQAIANGSTTCEDGLACVLLDASHADCTCPARTRTKTEGVACATNDDCAPGLLCAVTGAARACRAVCRCYAENGACTASDGDCPTAGTHCTPLEEGGVFGVCGN